jgi:hypothetical protein
MAAYSLKPEHVRVFAINEEYSCCLCVLQYVSSSSLDTLSLSLGDQSRGDGGGGPRMRNEEEINAWFLVSSVYSKSLRFPNIYRAGDGRRKEKIITKKTKMHQGFAFFI